MIERQCQHPTAEQRRRVPPLPSTRRRPRAPPSGARSRACCGCCWRCSPFHSFVAKPFYIPSESMMPALAQRRPAGGHQISLRLVVGAARASTSSRHWQGRAARQHARARRHRHRHAARDRATIISSASSAFPATRSQMRDGRADHQRPAREVGSCDRRRWSRSTPTRRAGSSSPGFRCAGRRTGQHYCRVPVVRETLPGGRATTRSTSAIARATISAQSRSPPAMSS